MLGSKTSNSKFMKPLICASVIAFSISHLLVADENTTSIDPVLTSPIGPSIRDLGNIEDLPNAIGPVFREPGADSRILSLYDQLRAGQTRSAVEKILGKPLIGEDILNGSIQWYINETERKTFQGSPWGFGGIRVHYDEEGRLVSATVNFQYVQDHHMESYLEKQNKKAEQDGTGQPATAPEPKPENGDKPQPESEGRPK